MSGSSYVAPSLADSPEFQQLRRDAQRWRFLRRYLLRQEPARTTTGSVRYGLELETPAPIDPAELDRILDACQATDDGRREGFLHGGEGAQRLGGQVRPATPRLPREGQVARAPIVCRCGAVRPRMTGRPPKVWECGACP